MPASPLVSDRVASFARRALGATLLAVLGLSPRIALAAWPSNSTVNVPLCTAAGDQEPIVSVSDGAGGAIVAWSDNRTDRDIYAQRVDAAGTPLWTAGGVPLCTAAMQQNEPVIASDGAGGAIVVWADTRIPSNGNLFAQRVDAAGVPLWTSNGVFVCGATGFQFHPKIASDGAGGVIVTWLDQRNGSDEDVYAQRLNPAGSAQWSSDGVAVCLAVDRQFWPTLTTDGAGGAIVTWYDNRTGIYDVYAQRVSAAGAVLWTADGVPVCTAPNYQTKPSIVPDGAGGAIISWMDSRGGSAPDIYAQRIDDAGAPLWTLDGIPICTAPWDRTSPLMVSDQAGGAIVTWRDLRGGVNDVYAQRVSSAGSRLWSPANGVVVCGDPGNQGFPTINPDGAGGAIVAWQDNRIGPTNFNVYAQRVDAAGVPQWTVDGAGISTATGDQYFPTVVTDGAGGAIVAWQDYRAGNWDVYAQRIGAGGVLGGGPGPIWTRNGSPVIAADWIQRLPAVVGDTRGGAIFAWEDHGAVLSAVAAGGRDTDAGRGGHGERVLGPGGARIRMDALDGGGNPVGSWPPAGLPVSTASGNELEPASVQDGAGGAIVVWTDDRSGSFDLYAQRVTGSGAIAAGWPAAGFPVCVATGQQQHPRVAPDGSGGMIVAWEDSRNGANVDVYAQRITGSAVLAAGWPLNGVAVCAASGNQVEPVADADGTGGAIIAWTDSRGGPSDVYAMRIVSAGGAAAGWPINGAVLGGASGDQTNPAIVADGLSGAFVAWGDARSGGADLYAQHVTADGVIAAGWTSDGNALTTASGPQQHPRIVSDGAGGAIVAWEDGRPDGSAFDVFAQRVTTNGSAAPGWNIDGNPLCTAPGDQRHVALITDGRGGAIASWEDGRYAGVDVFANQITAGGTIDPRWTPDGMLLCDASGSQSLPAIAPDGSGGAIVAWTDERVPASDVYALRISGNSLVLLLAVDPAPAVKASWLLPPRPNPATGTVQFSFELPAASSVRVEIVDLAGRRVRTVVDRQAYPAGFRTVAWDARDDQGSRLSAGIYFARFEAGDHHAVRRIALLP